jgi:meso-butanediol dehydrogenase / (S,S)-butanediol dehydrogenase / diacetyl reductase
LGLDVSCLWRKAQEEFVAGELQGRSIIVTGGSKGMGRAFVERLLQAGANVACFARPSPELEALKLLAGERLLVVNCDVSQSAAVNESVQQVASRFGAIDALINNAAIFQPFLIETATDAQIEQHVSTNILGPIWCIRASIEHLRASNGQIISISSESVRQPFPYLSVYAATKGALEVFSAAIREELRDQGIRVSVLRSGAVAGSSGGAGWDPDIAKEFFEKIQRTGHAAMAGIPVSQATMAEALLLLLTLPKDVNIDLLEARGARAGLVTDHLTG